MLLPYEPDIVRKRQSKKLPDACCSYGIEGWENLDKSSMAADIGAGRWQLYGRQAVLDYCEEDVRKSAQLFEHMLRGYIKLDPVDPELVLHWSNYSAKAVAQFRLKAWRLIWISGTWFKRTAARSFATCSTGSTLAAGAKRQSITTTASGLTSSFEQHLVRTGVVAWPRLESGRLDIDGDAFRLMRHVPA